MSTLSIITPALLDIGIRQVDGGPCPKWILIKNWGLILFGAIGSIFGTVLSVLALIHRHA